MGRAIGELSLILHKRPSEFLGLSPSSFESFAYDNEIVAFISKEQERRMRRKK